MEKKIEKKGKWYYLYAVLLTYFSLFFINKEVFAKTSIFFYELMFKILPILIFILILMAIINYFVSPKKIIKYLGKEAGIKGWLIAIFGGIASHGPIYVWYPLMEDLKNKGVRISFIATFLYNRAIKLPLLPIMILYFSWEYVLILTILMIFVSIIQGLIVEKIVGL